VGNSTASQQSIQKGTQATYAFGEIAYDDAFGECRVTSYRSHYSAAAAAIGAKIGLSYLDERNTETGCPRTQ
jgi:hypothetical protein